MAWMSTEGLSSRVDGAFLAVARDRVQYLGALSHQLHTPMNGVRVVAEMLRRMPLDPQAQRHVATILDSAGSMIRVLEDALDVARAEAGELDLHPEPVLIRTLMDQVQETWSRRAVQDNVSLLTGYEGDTELSALIDVARVGQVFNNLIGNALRFTRNGTVEVRLSAMRDEDVIRIRASVRDEGAGIDPTRLQSIFEPFRPSVDKLDTGLGLAICRQIIERMDGRIWAGNNAGSGATIAFELTVEAVHSYADNLEHLDERTLSLQPHVLIVDDNATNRVVAQALCEMFDCTCEVAGDGIEALEAVGRHAFDLILMDIKMPRMDGVQATRAIRALPGPAGATPIIALTANADPDDARAYVAAGMAAVVEKPIKPERLMMAMNTALGQSEVDEGFGLTAAVA